MSRHTGKTSNPTLEVKECCLEEIKSKLSHKEEELSQAKSQDEAHLNFPQPNQHNLPESSVNIRHFKKEASLLSAMNQKEKINVKPIQSLVTGSQYLLIA